MNYHLIGIGGIGMSALAHLLLEKGYGVQGSDIKENENTQALQKKGVEIAFCEKPDCLKKDTTLIYSSAIQEDHTELKRAKELSLKILHRSEALQLVIEGLKTYVVTGTHGKTTTSALLTNIFKQAKRKAGFLVGGHLKDDLQHAKMGESEFILEADESDGSFLRVSPDHAIITSLNYDHLYFWKTKEKQKLAFQTFAKNSKRLIYCIDDERLKELNLTGISYGFSNEAKAKITRYFQEKDRSIFDFTFEGKHFDFVELNLLGKHNALNALGAFLLALQEGIEEKEIREALMNFQGVKRRMEHLGKNYQIDFYDDYAHHPEEITVSLKALREKVGVKRIVTIFEPHRQDRFNHFYYEYIKAFEDADYVFVQNVYMPAEGKTSQDFVKDVKNCAFYTEDALKDYLRPFDVVITLGAGVVTNIGRDFVSREQPFFKKHRLFFLYGGESIEREISKSSTKNILKHIDPELFDLKKLEIPNTGTVDCVDLTKKVLESDFVFPLFHGKKGEDGMIQGFLSTLGAKYVGGDYQALAFSMNKAYVKALAQKNGLLTLPFIDLTKREWEKTKALDLEEMKFPVWVKGCHLGSSLGVHRIEKLSELVSAVEKVFELDDHLIIEEGIQAREIEVAILGSGNKIQVLHPGEVFSKAQFHDFEKKYGKNAHPMTGKARLAQEWVKKVSKMAEMLYDKAGLKGFARIDFFLNDEGDFFFNEINPIPGMTPTSLFPMIAKEAGISLSELMEQLTVDTLYAR